MHSVSHIYQVYQLKNLPWNWRCWIVCKFVKNSLSKLSILNFIFTANEPHLNCCEIIYARPERTTSILPIRFTFTMKWCLGWTTTEPSIDRYRYRERLILQYITIIMMSTTKECSFFSGFLSENGSENGKSNHQFSIFSKRLTGWYGVDCFSIKIEIILCCCPSLTRIISCVTVCVGNSFCKVFFCSALFPESNWINFERLKDTYKILSTAHSEFIRPLSGFVWILPLCKRFKR